MGDKGGKKDKAKHNRQMHDKKEAKGQAIKKNQEKQTKHDLLAPPR
jgi:hypothetical protein